MNISKLLPEINLITSDDLKEKLMHIYEKILKIGEWSEEDLKRIPFTLLIPELVDKTTNIPKITIIDHIRAVTKMSIAVYDIYEGLGLGKDLIKDELIAGAILHDIGKFIEYEKDKEGKIVPTRSGKILRHPAQGLEFVAEFNLPLSVRQAIVFHSKEGDQINRLPEVEIISRSDFLCFIPVKKILQD
ncbi:MAG: HD domain-containing protein [Candidatus Hodarchaeales archaeon]|jgi:putative nucleotidyltransferase with HDIG domain